MNLQPEPPRSLQVDLEGQHRRLRILVQATAVSVLILTGTLFVFLYRQVVLVRRQTAELTRYINEVNESGMSQFFMQVRDRFNTFRKEHPDFNPIYARYFGTNEPPASERITNAPPASTNKAP
jgi:hypothetical protein